MSEIAKGAYCFATKYNDGDPGDAWAVGYYMGTHPGIADVRHLVGGTDGVSYRASGYRRVRAGLNADVGRWLLENAAMLEKSPPGTVNLWSMLTEAAFIDGADELAAGSVGQQDNPTP